MRDYVGSDGLEGLEIGGGRVPDFELEEVGYVAKEVETFLWGPEERVTHHCCGIGTFINVSLMLDGVKKGGK